jgi:hypothetical protein
LERPRQQVKHSPQAKSVRPASGPKIGRKLIPAHGNGGSAPYHLSVIYTITISEISMSPSVLFLKLLVLKINLTSQPYFSGYG